MFFIVEPRLYQHGQELKECQKAIERTCEVSSLIGKVDELDMQILEELSIIRIKADVKSIEKFPPAQGFTNIMSF
jgi:hypothetical protein